MGHWLLSQENKITRQRLRISEPQLDLMKLYGMFCAVYAHGFFRGVSLSGHLTVSSVYVIQLFMFCSGYFYRIETDSNAWGTILNKYAKAYLLPYYVWNLVYGLVAAGLRAAGLISYGEPISLYSLFLQPWVHGEQFALNTPSWFLLTLFEVAVLSWLLRRLFLAGKENRKIRDHALLIAELVFSVGSIFLLNGVYQFGIKATCLRMLVLLPFYQMGFIYRNYWKGMGRKTSLLLMAGILVLQLMLPVLNGGAFSTKMLYSYFVGNPLLLTLCSFSAVLLIAELCRWLGPVAGKFRCVKFLSRCTMSTMCHHLFVLVLIQMGYLVLHHLGIANGFSPEKFAESIWYQYSYHGNLGRWCGIAAAFVVPSLGHWCWEWCILRCSALVRRKPASAEV